MGRQTGKRLDRAAGGGRLSAASAAGPPARAPETRSSAEALQQQSLGGFAESMWGDGKPTSEYDELDFAVSACYFFNSKRGCCHEVRGATPMFPYQDRWRFVNVSSIKPYRLKAILFSLLSCTLLISCTALASSDRASTTQTVLGEWSTVGGPAFGCNGQINAIRRATTGQIYIGGQFSVCGGEEVHNIALYDPVANEFHALVHDGVNGVGGNVSSIFIDANQVYVGGSFQTAGPTNSNNIARWDGAQWHH